MSWFAWRAHFERNAVRPFPVIPVAIDDVPSAQRAPLLRCLAHFQLGETGGHHIVRQIEEEPLPGSDEDHRAALQLFVREEARHAQILGRLVTGLGGELLSEHWSHGAFVFLRRLAGLRLKLVLLDVAEVIGIACYALLADRLPVCSVRTALVQIAADEEHHLAFHSSFFARQGYPFWVRALWWTVGVSACIAILFDQGRALSALGVGRRTLWSRMTALLSDGDRQMRAPLALEAA